MVYAVAADEADALAVLVREHPPPVDLLLVHPAGVVERRADGRRGHRRVLPNHNLMLAQASVNEGFLFLLHRDGEGLSLHLLRRDIKRRPLL